MITEDLLSSSKADPVAHGEEVLLLDEAGHLTLEAAAFPGELGVYQRAVVERHMELCDVCAHQVADLARARQRLTRQQPHTVLPAGLERLGHQVAMRSLPLAEAALQQRRMAAATEASMARRRRRWRVPPGLLIALMVGMAATLVVAALALSLSGCSKKKPEAGPLKISLAAPVELTRVGGVATAVARAVDGRLAVGAEDGKIRLLAADLKGDPLELKGHPGESIAALAFAGAGKQLVSAAGKEGAVWDLAKKARLRDLRGPQPITTLAVGPKGEEAFFGTDQGHVMRWDLSTSKAKHMPRFPCGATGVPPARMQLKPSKRCRFGTYFQADDGQHACLYPVSLLVVHGTRLFRACREGTFATREIAGGESAWFRAGHLSLLTPMPPDLMLQGRAEGELNVYSPGKNKLARTLAAPKKKPLAAAATDKLLAVAQEGGQILVWSRPGKTPAASVKSAPAVVWMHLSDSELRYLARDGRMISHKVSTSR